MKTETSAYKVEANKRFMQPRYVVAISFDDADTDITYVSSHTDCLDPGGVAAIDRIDNSVISISGLSQKINPKRAAHTIGAISIVLWDTNGELTTKINTKLLAGEGLRKKTIALYQGFSDLTSWSDYSLKFTYKIDQVSVKDNAYTFDCSDITRQTKEKIFIADQGSLTASVDIGDSLVSVTIPDASEKFQLTAHDALYASNPSGDFGYIKIDDEIICHSGWSDANYDKLQVVERGAFRTAETVHTVSTANTQQTKHVDEFVYLEMPVVKMVYAILTGVLHGQGSSTLPDNWHLSVPVALVNSTDFTGIGDDLWDSVSNDGRIARFIGEQEVSGKKFLEEQLLLWSGTYMPVKADGRLSLKRLASTLPDSAYSAYVDKTQIHTQGKLTHNQKAVVNDITIRWSWIDDLQRYTKATRLKDLVSKGKYSDAKAQSYEFRGVFKGLHDDGDLQNYFRQLRDRYTAPPLETKLTVLPVWSKLDVGDIVRVNNADVKDYNTDTALDRSFEIQHVRTDWKTGLVTWDLFGGVEQSAQDILSTDYVMEDSFYTSTGTALTSVLTIVGGNVTVSGTLTGSAADHNAAVYYYDGDLTIADGVTVTITENVQLRIKGDFTVNGDLTGKGNGNVGATGDDFIPTSGPPDPDGQGFGTVGIFGAFGSPGVTLATQQSGLATDGSAEVWEVEQDDPSTIETALTSLNIKNPAGTALTGLPLDLRGSSGSAGGVSADFSHSQTPKWQKNADGGDGGDGGSALVIISRSGDIGPSGVIDISGDDGSLGASGVTYHGLTMHGSAGVGGSGGGLVWLIDGNATLPPRVGITINNGLTPIAIVDNVIAEDVYRALIPLSESAVKGHHMTQVDQRGSNLLLGYIPKQGSSFTWYPSDEQTITTTPMITIPSGNTPGQVLLTDSNGNLVWSYIGPEGASTEYCAGYPYTFVDTDTWRIENLDARNQFIVGRRLKFIDGSSLYYGTVSAIDYDVTSADDTTIDMTMEGGDVLTATVGEVCFVTGTAAWTPIVEDPFAGSSINDICTGLIGATEWWFAVGNGGKIAVSSNAGLNWTVLTTATSENFNACVYDSDYETFWAGGDAGVLANTTDCLTITSEDTTSIPALTGTDNYNINGFAYSETDGALLLLFKSATAQWKTAGSINQGGAWTAYAVLGALAVDRALKANWVSSTVRGNSFYSCKTSDTSSWLVLGYTDITFAAAHALGAGNVITAIGQFYDGGTCTVYGDSDGDIYGSAIWTGDDTATFVSQINGFAHSDFDDRLVCVGNSGTVGYWNVADKTTADKWNFIATGFDPLTNVNAVARNESDGIFVAVASNGQICRSSSGIN